MNQSEIDSETRGKPAGAEGLNWFYSRNIIGWKQGLEIIPKTTRKETFRKIKKPKTGPKLNEKQVEKTHVGEEIKFKTSL